MGMYQRHPIKINFLGKDTLATYPENLNKQKALNLIHGVIVERMRFRRFRFGLLRVLTH